MEDVVMGHSHNVFVSHRHEDDVRVGQLKDLLRARGIEVRDSSITKEKFNRAKDSTYIKEQILGPRIRWAGKLVVIVSPDTKNHRWVDWEVDYANKQGGKRIIGVWAPGSEECDLPTALERHADAVVPWNADKILDALEGGDNWERPDGSPRRCQPISRVGC